MQNEYNPEGSYLLVVCPNPSVDIFAWGAEIKPRMANRLEKELHYPGGKGVHVGLAAAELGEKVLILGFWGGPTGAWIKAQCEKNPLVRCIGSEVEGWSRSCYTYKSTVEFDDTEILGVGPKLKKRDWSSFMTIYKGYLDEARAISMSGSWPEGAPDDAYAQLINIATERKKATFVDCTGVQLENALLAHPYMVHVNRSEMIDHTKNYDLNNGALKLTEQCEYAAVTDGARGLFLAAKDGKIVHASCAVNKVISAVGSGDCLTAGLLVGYARGYDVYKSARLGVASGAANCLREDLGMLYAKDVEQLLTKTKLIETIVHSN